GHENARQRCAREPRNGGRAIGGDLRAIPVLAEHLREALGGADVVFDDEDERFHAAFFAAWIVMTGRVAVRMIFSATLPMMACEIPLRPCVPMTMTSALISFAI